MNNSKEVKSSAAKTINTKEIQAVCNAYGLGKQFFAESLLHFFGHRSVLGSSLIFKMSGRIL